jgi:polar amino acid transport system ATP-binding protein
MAEWFCGTPQAWIAIRSADAVTVEVLKVMEDLAQRGMTMVLVTHEMAFARRVADQVVFMHKGKVWEAGPTAQVFAHPGTAEFTQFIGTGL